MNENPQKAEIMNKVFEKLKTDCTVHSALDFSLKKFDFRSFLNNVIKNLFPNSYPLQYKDNKVYIL